MKPPPTQHDSMHLHEIIQVCMKLVSKDTCEAKEIPHVPDLFENLVFVRWEVLRREKRYHQENIESSHYPESTLQDSEVWRVSSLSIGTEETFLKLMIIG